MNFNDEIAKEIIRERISRKVPTRRPSHPRAAHALRRLATRLDNPS